MVCKQPFYEKELSETIDECYLFDFMKNLLLMLKYTAEQLDSRFRFHISKT